MSRPMVIEKQTARETRDIAGNFVETLQSTGLRTLRTSNYPEDMFVEQGLM